MKEKLKNIPQSWEEVKVDLISELIRGVTYKKEVSSEIEKKEFIPILRANNINKNQLNFDSLIYVPEQLVKDIQLIVNGDIIFAMSSGSKHLVGKSAQAYKDYKASVGSFCAILRPYNNVSKKFIAYFFQSSKFRHLISKSAKGTNINNLKREQILDSIIPLPPLNEQKRIVEKIDELFSDLDNGVANLKKAQNQLKVYRQALLKNAFEGKLTEQWRKENNPEPAEKLLERIKKERQKRYEQELADWKEAVNKWEEEGKKGKKPRRPKEYDELPPLTSEELKNLPNLPKGWKWIKNNELLYYVTSGSRDWKKYYSNKGAYFIRTQDIKYNSLNIENVAFVDLPKDVEGKRSLVEQGDILMTITGANVGKVAFIQKDLPETYVSQSVALMKLTYNKIAPYLHYYFQSNFFGKKFIEELVYGVGRPVLSLENMKEVFVALCSLEEQNQIVSILEEQFSVIDKLEEEIEKALKKSQTLRQSILKKAFEGKLVPQDPNDEPASELLKGIKAEKEKYLAEQKEKKKKPVKRKQMDKNLSIEEVLKKSKEPIPAKDVWQQSKHKDDIEAFYAELKKIQHNIKEIKKGTESLLELKR